MLSLRERVRGRLFGGAANPASIGGFAIRRWLASGATGDVFLAEDPTLARPVAIKVLHTDDGDHHRARRLLLEARALARLAHPNIVHVYEAGEHHGRYYIAMEYIDGSSLLDWQRHASRSIAELLPVYLSAARGLGAAHQVGIIHRDVKPANILVGDSGRVCVVDFGLAHPQSAPTADEQSPNVGDDCETPRAVAPENDGSSRSRAPYGGTPAYMSPEAVRSRGSAPRSDVFSWAVSLYEAIYGKRPFTVEQLRGGAALSVAPASVRPRGEPVPWWMREMLIRALAWDPERRFQSFDELLATVSAATRAATRRRAAGVMTVVAVAATAISWSYFGQARCPSTEDFAERVWNATGRDESRRGFMESRFSFAAPAWAFADATLTSYEEEWAAARVESCVATRVTAERSDELFDLSTACLNRRRMALEAVVNQVRVAGRAEVSEVESILGTLPDISVCLDDIALRRDPRLGATATSDTDVAEVEALVARSQLATARGDHDSGADLANRAVELALRTGDSGIVADALFARGRAHKAIGHTAAAVSDLSGAANAADAGSRDELRPSILLELAWVSIDLQEDLVAGAAYMDRAAAAMRRGRDSVEDSAEVLELKARILLESGDASAAETLLLSALEMRRDVALRHPSAVSSTLMLLGRCALSRGDFELAEERYLEARDSREDLFGDDHPLTADVDFNLGLLSQARGDMEASVRQIARVLEVLSATYGSSAPRLANVHVALGSVVGELGDASRALAESKAALAIQRLTPQPELSVVIAAHRIAANSYRELGRDAEALAENQMVLAVETGKTPEIELVPVLINVGHYLCRGGIDAKNTRLACADARPVFERALQALASRAASTSDATLVPYVRKGLGRVELAAGNPNRALDHLLAARAALDELGLDDRVLSGEVALATARAYLDLADLDSSAAQLQISRRMLVGASDVDPDSLRELDQLTTLTAEPSRDE